jgi:hypothetical protein
MQVLGAASAVLVALQLLGSAACAETYTTPDQRIKLSVDKGWEQIANDATRAVVLNCAGSTCIKNSRVYASGAIYQNLIGIDNDSFFRDFTIDAFNSRTLKSLDDSRLIGTSVFVSRDVWPGYIGYFSVGNGRAVVYFTGFNSKNGAVATVRMFVAEAEINAAKFDVIAISQTVDIRP